MKHLALLLASALLLNSCAPLDKQLAKHHLTTADVIAAALAAKADVQARQAANQAAGKNPVPVQP